MIRFDLEKVFDMASEFADEHKNSPLANDVEYLFEWLGGMRNAYTNGEVARVVNSLSGALRFSVRYAFRRQP